jgi:hypothetical protein
MSHISYVLRLPFHHSYYNNKSSQFRLDSIGIAGFSHDFGSLKGNSPPVVAALDALGSMNNSFSSMLVLALSQVFPPLINIPTPRLKKIKNICSSIGDVAGALIDSARVENEASRPADKSIIGTLGELKQLLFRMHIEAFISQVRDYRLRFDEYDK